jgi:hypothetical protein
LLKKGEFKRGVAPLKQLFPLPLIEGKGTKGIGLPYPQKDIKWVPRKIFDFSGCLKGIGLP